MGTDKDWATESRKIQFTGSSSFVITLPKNWCKRLGLTPGDRLSVTEQPDGSLQIRAGTQHEPEPKIAEIKIEAHSDPESLRRIFISKYLAGHQIFRFGSSQSIPMELRRAITSQAASLLGLEVIEETDKTIEVQDLLSPEELTVEKAIRRAHLVASSMYETALNALETKNRRMAEDVIDREPSVDRLYFLILRQLALALQNPTMLGDLGIKAVETMDYQMLAKSIERIADHAFRIGKTILETDLEVVEEETLSAIVQVGREANRMNSDAMRAFLAKDVQLANKAIATRKATEARIAQLNEKLIKRQGEGSVNLRIITDSIERISDYGANMAEIAIDRNR